MSCLLAVFALLCFLPPSLALPSSWTSLFPSIVCSHAGLTGNLPLCTATTPCTNLLATYAVGSLVEADSVAGVLCRTTLAIGTSARDDGVLKTIAVGGTVRYYCDSGGAPNLPLVIFFHGSGGSASNVYDLYDATFAGFRQLADSYTLKPGTTGYRLVSIHSRNRHFPSLVGEDGAKHNFLTRDLSKNDDVALVDALIDQLSTQGLIDPKFIFTAGGSRFSFILLLLLLTKRSLHCRVE